MRRHVARAWASSALAGAVVLGLATGANADPDTTPSASEVERAREREAAAKTSVHDLEQQITQLAALQQQTEAKAQQAVEAYNAANEQLSKAEAESAAATKQAKRAQQSFDEAQAALAQYAIEVREYQPAAAVFGPLLTGDGLDVSLKNAEMLDLVGDMAAQLYERANVARNERDRASKRAKAAVEQRTKAAEQLKGAKDQASAASERVLTSQKQAEETLNQLLADLAAKRHTTVALERKRMNSVVAERNREINEAASRDINERRPAERDTSDHSGQSDRDRNDNVRPTPDRDSGSDTPPAPQPKPKPKPKPDPKPDPAPQPATGGMSASRQAAALQWARAQIGKPYVWGGSGPNGFDCSGLTSQAYLKATGVWIGRTAQDQYYSGVRIPIGQARAGDLIFRSSNGGASGIRHVMILSGGGRMVEAPKPGQNVREQAIWWVDVLPYAVRPNG